MRCLQRTRTSCTDPWACPRCCSGRQAHEEVITRSALFAPHCLQFPALVLNSNRSSLSFVKAVGIEPLIDCSLLSACVWNQARQCLHDRVLNCLQYRVLCSSMDVQCGDYHLCGLYLHSLSLSVKRGYVGPSMVPGSWEWGWGHFYFSTLLFFLFARSLWFFKKVRRETKKQQGSP